MQSLILYLQPFLLALFLSLIFMQALIAFSEKYNLFDTNDERKRHIGRISRLGGLGIIAAFWLAIFLSGSLVFDSLKVGLIVCSLVIFVVGLWDDLKNLSWKKQLALQILVALIMIYAGLGVDYIANPFGGREFRLDSFSFMDYSVIGSIFVILWIVGFMNVVNWLDGMDGLAGGVGAIGAFTLFLLSISDLVNQPPLAVMAISLFGALLGFLFFNFNPAKIFMGSSGALFLGFILSVLAIFSGGKIATVFLVMGFPIFDALWVILKRRREGKSLFLGDRSHFYHYLLDERGWAVKKIVFSIYALCIVFGLSALIFQGLYKFIALLSLFIVVFYLIRRRG